jgi:hypothetical protein
MTKKKIKQSKQKYRCLNNRKKHEWETIRSLGHWGQEAVCVKCGIVATFVMKEE